MRLVEGMARRVSSGVAVASIGALAPRSDRFVAQPHQHACRDRLLRAPAPAGFARLRPHLTLHPLALDAVLVPQAFFIEQGIVSLMARA